MFKRLIVFGICTAGLICTAAPDQPAFQPAIERNASDGKPAPKAPEQPKLRRCFRDADHDGKCDNSISEGRKCPRNCVDPSVKPAPPKTDVKPAPEPKKDIKTPCAACPLAGKCADQPKPGETQAPKCEIIRQSNADKPVPPDQQPAKRK